MIRRPKSHRRGIALVLVIGCLFAFVIILGVMIRVGVNEVQQSRIEERRMFASWLAESGLERAWSKLAASREYTGETWTLTKENLDGVIRITVEAVPDAPHRRLVRAQAEYPASSTTHARQTRTAEITLPSSGEPR